jgi:predicted DNA-binding antitoxin AbrB/MazE fold protein
MTITREAIYANGQLTFKEPLVLPEGTTVRVTIVPLNGQDDPLAGVIGVCNTGRTDGAENHDKYLQRTRQP